MRLSDGKKYRRYIIGKIQLDEAVIRRLHTLGMTSGTIINVLNLKKAGPMIVKVRGTRFALGRGFCEGIFVEEACDD